MAENEVKNDLISRTAVINLLKKLRLDNVAMNDKRITGARKMKLYEFMVNRRGEIEVNEYEVRETEKMYILEKPHSYIQFNACTRIQKEIAGEVQREDYRDRKYFFSLENDINKARDAFISYIKNVEIPKKQGAIDEAMCKMNISKEVLACLESQKGE